MECLICHYEAYKFKTKDGFNIYKCSGCGLDFLNPMPSENELHRFYSNDYMDIRQSQKVTRKVAETNLKEIIENFSISKDSKVLDFGCGDSNSFIGACRDFSYNNSFGYDKYSNNEDDESRISWDEVQENKYDLITLWGILEHLVDPIKTLSLIRTLLSPNGLIILTTVFSDMPIPFRYKPPEHTLYYTKEAMPIIAKSSGLVLLKLSDYFINQDSDVYFEILLRTMPEKYKKLCAHKLPEFVYIPTNERLVVMRNNLDF
jgi:hypothetical protein